MPLQNREHGSRSVSPESVPERREQVALDRFGLLCARVEELSLDERLNAVRQVRDKIYKNRLVPCQGLNLGYVITKRPALSDFA